MDFAGDIVKATKPGTSDEKDKSDQLLDDIVKEMDKKTEASNVAAQLKTKGSPFEEDIIREFDQKASELSSFLQQSAPDLTASLKTTKESDFDLIKQNTSQFESDLDLIKPNTSQFQSGNLPDFTYGAVSGSGIGNLIGDITNPDNMFKMDSRSDKTEVAAGGDMKTSADELSDSSMGQFERISPNMLDFGLESTASPKEEKDDSLKSSLEMDFSSSLDSALNQQSEPKIAVCPSGPAPTHELFHGTQSEPILHMEQHHSDLLLEGIESPKLPESPCRGPPSPTIISQRLEPEVVPSPPSPIKKEDIVAAVADDKDDYTRRQTKTYDNESPILPKEPEKAVFHNDSDDDIPPPIPKHAYELDAPPPVPKHADESLFNKSREPPLLHKTYDDHIDDEFDEDSIQSQPLSKQLSDSLEVLKESPQKDMPMDESLMDLDELPSSSKNSLKSISPTENKSLLGDLAGEPAPVGNLPQEMMESGLFTQQPPKELFNDPVEIDEKFDFKVTQEVEQTKPVASIPPFTKEKHEPEDLPNLPADPMIGSINLQTLDEIQAPKYYESEDSSSKTDIPNDDLLKLAKDKRSQPDDSDDFEDLIPKDSFESVSNPKLDSKESDLLPNIVEESEVKIQKPVKQDVVKAQANLAEDGDISEEMRQLLNTFNPKAWFDPSKLHPTVSELVYWRDPKKSGIVFGSVFVVLIALTLLSLISVVAYTSLAVLSGTFAFRVYKSVLQAVQKTNDGHPFKEYLDLDLALPSDKAQELSTAIINYLNTTVTQLRRLFLVEDLVDSAKFGLFLYALTYIGSWFNGLTLLILSFVALFALPKVYETNKTVIDQYIDLVWGKIAEINAKVTAAVPFLKKEKSQ